MKLLINFYVNDAANMPATSPVTTNKKHLKILLYGNIQGAQHRSQTLIKFLLDSRYPISLVCPNIYVNKGIKSSVFINKFLTKFHLIEFLIKAAFSDVIYMLPLNASLIGNAIFVAKIFKNKLIAENHVSLYDTLIEETKTDKENKRKAKIEMRRDELAMTKPDYVINTYKHETAYWQNKLGIKIDIDKIYFAPIFSSSTLMSERRFMQDGILRICWWGSFIPLHGLDNILQAMKLLKEREVRFSCNLFGIDSPSFIAYAEKIRFYELDSSVFLRKDLTFFDDSLPQFLIENCDLALGIFGNTCKAYNTVPTKLVEALSMGIPTLTMNSPALTEFFDPQIDLWTCEPSPMSIAETIMKIISGMVHSVNWDQTRQKVLSTFSITQYQMAVSRILGKIADDTY